MFPDHPERIWVVRSYQKRIEPGVVCRAVGSGRGTTNSIEHELAGHIVSSLRAIGDREVHHPLGQPRRPERQQRYQTACRTAYLKQG